ncbi:hypothetical protein [Aporhodopirellula aestuarii]|uniref:Uncharacterized protein n=1 Tax=Aporhodopirellula aestuarii TaxID=2950107 RepID=A0ABT0U1S1_9BACT|nr:hypothetical protein [Aporhodopirellula aestuarii]MCM2370828.1 hypothetical protein [Aporhodopirellula aestuarii]
MVDHLVAKRLLPDQPSEGIWCVLTQDCDLVHHDLSGEPKVEVVLARHVDKPNKGYTWSKNARELHLRDESLGQSLAFHARDRETIPRWQLCSFQPNEVPLSRDSIKLLARWVSRKYYRAAFPGAFNDRIGRKTDDKIKKLLQKSPGHFHEIHIQITGDELPAGQDYNAIILCIAADEALESDKAYEATIELGKKFRALLQGCDGINVVECQVKSRDEVTLEDLDSMQRWDFDSITIRQTDTIDDTPADH